MLREQRLHVLLSRVEGTVERKRECIWCIESWHLPAPSGETGFQLAERERAKIRNDGIGTRRPE